MHFKFYCILIHFIAFYINHINSDQLPTCQPDNFKYEFTECDAYNGRWRVSVPLTPHTCTGGAPNAPIRVEGCSISCDPGQFFNSTSLVCENCQKGYYSLGGGVRFASFKNISSLPSGFGVTTETSHKNLNCIGWHSRVNFLESISKNTGGGCVSIVTYTVKIVKSGKLRFAYQYLIPDDLAASIIFTFHYRNFEENGDNDTPGYNSDNNNIKFPTVTTQHEKWKTIEVSLKKPGLYVFAWKSVTIGHGNGNFGADPDKTVINNTPPGTQSDYGIIRIKSIEVDGVAYASECSPCEAGTFSDINGANLCKPCPPNTAYDKTGSSKCTPCDGDTQYAPPGAERCSPKPICGENDYYDIVSECDTIKKKQMKVYKWIEPKICRDKNHILPNAREEDCNATKSSKMKNQLCNAGMEIKSDGKCKFCAENEYNDGTLTKCQLCPTSTSPQYALSYTIWHNGKSMDSALPMFFSSQCVRGDEETECESTSSWQSSPDTKHYIRTSPSSLLDSFLILSLSVPGFRNNAGGEITFNFEIECMFSDKCLFIFMESRNGILSHQQTNVIHQWKSDSISDRITDPIGESMQTFKYRIEQNATVQFGWIFRRENNFQSHVKIYEIIVKDTMVGGAIKCNPCPHGTGINCVPCPFGQYLNMDENVEIEESLNRKRVYRNVINSKNNLKDNSKCNRCPKNSMINASISYPIGKKSCIACGPQLISNTQGTACFSDCKIDMNGEKFDLSQIKHPLLMRGGRLFTSGGTQYFHVFNITFCGNHGALCVNNITSYGPEEEFGIRAMICRSTIIPDGDQIFATQSVSLGDELIGITRETIYNNISVHPEFRTTNSDLHLYFTTKIPTAACESGRRLTLTIRCAPELEEEVSISTPKSCPDGTCDGCNFHLLVRTKTAAACRLCLSSDYEIVVGECINGIQQIHYVNPKGCIISPNGEIPIETRPCSVIPKQVQFGIVLVSALGVILLVLVFHFWKKNRRLEYKYCKLIENEKTAECCAEDDDDEEEPEITVHGRKHKASGESGYESIQLTKHERDDMI